MPQNSNFLLLRGHRFGQKIELMVMAPNHGGDPLGSILRSMGSHWSKKLGQNRQKLPCPKIRIFDYSARSSIWAKIEFMVMVPNQGMVIFYGFDPFFGPNGTPLAPRWTLGGPHRDLAP